MCALRSLLRCHIRGPGTATLGSPKLPQGDGGGILLALGLGRGSFANRLQEDGVRQLVGVAGSAWALRHGTMVTREVWGFLPEDKGRSLSGTAPRSLGLL